MDIPSLLKLLNENDELLEKDEFEATGQKALAKFVTDRIDVSRYEGLRLTG